MNAAMVTIFCQECDGAGEWDEGPLPATSRDQISPEYLQVICPACGGSGVENITAEEALEMSRTYGETQDCFGCRFWSEMVAQSVGCGPIEAICLSGDGSLAGKYTTGRKTCSAWKSGHFGAVDDPPNYGEEARALYEAEEAAPQPEPATGAAPSVPTPASTEVP